MNFLVEGVNFHNKGAELMLCAIKQQLHEWNSDNKLSLDLRTGSFEQRNQAGVNHLIWLESKKLPMADSVLNLGASIIPKNIRKKYNLTLKSEVEVVLDASGFYFSDQWGAATTEVRAEIFSRWKKQGKKLIFLPQAFGPFNNDRIQQAFIQIINNADLVFAREHVSYEHIVQLPVSTEHVKVYPDFTNLVQGIDPPYINNLIGRPCIVPNYRIIDKTSSLVSSKYINFLTSSISYLQEKKFEPFILIHEKFDYELATKIQKSLEKEITIITENNPLYLKSILGKCYLVIGSRFHGLISALSQGTPCLGTGWSHKYQMLFKDYNCMDLLVDLDSSIKENFSKIDLLITEPKRNEITDNLKQSAQCQKALSQQMWSEVKSLVFSSKLNI